MECGIEPHQPQRHANERREPVGGRVTLIDRSNTPILELGDNGIDSWKPLRAGTRDQFPIGKFVCPHSACFDHDGNIFVVEWVEIGRVTKLRRV